MSKKIDFCLVIEMLIIGFVFTLFTLTGIWTTDQLQFSDQTGAIVLWFCKYFFLYCGLVLLVLAGKKKLMQCVTIIRINSIVEEKVSLKCEIMVALVILWAICIPALLAVFPGIFGNDGPVEMFWMYGESSALTAHHPLAHVYLMKVCFETGYFLCGNYNVGLFLYSIIQLLIMTGTFIYSIAWMRKKNITFLLRVIAFLFFAFNPVIQLLNLNTTKDTIFSAFFLLGVLFLIDLIEKQSFKNIIHFLIASFGICIFRNQGYIILAFVGLGALFFLKKRGLKVFGIIMVSAIIGWFLMGPFVDMMGIPRGDSREMYSVPMQQIARVWNEAQSGNAELTEEDKESIEALIPIENLQLYTEYNADYVKVGFKTQILQENLSEYLKLYIKLGIKYPDIYLRAFTSLVSGFWDITQYGEFRSLLYTNTYTESYYNVCEIERNSLFPEYESYLTTFAHNLECFPLFNILFSHVLPVLFLVIVVVDSLIRKQWIITVPMLFLFGQWGIMLLSPAMLIRYAYPLIVCVPILISLILQPECVLKQQEMEQMKGV